MRHLGRDGKAEFGIHEAYFSETGELITYTEDSLSSRQTSVELLRANLRQLVSTSAEEFVCGDLGYTYSREEIEEWIKSTEQEPLEYAEAD